MEEKEYSAAKALVMKDNKILVLKFLVNETEVFDLPGGKQEVGETIEETLNREVFEETHLKVKSSKKIGKYWFKRLSDDVKINCTLFSCEVGEGSVDFMQNPSEHEKFEARGFLWVPKEEFSLEKYYFGNISRNFMNLIGIKLKK